MAMDEQFAEVLAGLIGAHLTTSVALAVSKQILASAEASSNTMASLVRQSNNAAMVELATCARCVEEILGPLKSSKKKQRELSLSAEEEFVRLSAGAPVVT